MDKEPPSTPQQNIRINKKASLDKAQVGIAGGNFVQIQILDLFGFGKKESFIQQDSLQLRDKLIRDLKERIDNAILKSLHKELLIQLDKETDPHCVQPISVENIKLDNRQSEDLPENTSLVDVFFKFRGKLLILGAPGAGKTTEMLEIARKSVSDFESDCNKPIPIWLDLSSWKDENQTFTQWLVMEISLKYNDNSRKNIKKFVKEHQLILFLDNFEKLVYSNRHEKCVKEINDVLESNKYCSSMVVCSRDEAYKQCKTELKLNEAVFLKPLNNSKIESHLAQLELLDLWQQIKCKNELLKLAKTPFLLNIIILAYGPYRKRLPKKWDSLNEKEMLKRVLDDFINRMLKDKQRQNSAYQQGKEPKPEKTINILSSIANIQESRGEQEFYSKPGFLIEDLQPSLLHNFYQKWLYNIGVWIIYCSFAGMALWEIGLLTSIKRLHLNVYKLSDASLVVISSGILLGIFILIAATTASVQNKSLSIKMMGKLSFIVIGLIFLITGCKALSDRDILLRFSSQSTFQFSDLIYSLFAGIFIVLFSSILGSLYGLIMGIVSFLVSMLIGENKDLSINYRRSRIKPVEIVTLKNLLTSQIKVVSASKLKPRKQTARTVREKLLIIFSCGVLGWMIGDVLGLVLLNENLILWLGVGVYIAEIDNRIKELIIRAFHGRSRKRAIKWQKFMQVIIFSTASGITAYNIPDTILPKFIIVFMFSTMTIILGLLKWEDKRKNQEQTITNIILISPFKKTISINILKTILPALPEKIDINQGIWRSGFNAIKCALVTGLLISILTAIQLHSAGLSSWLGSLLLGLLTFGLKGGFTAGLLLGGKAVIQHFVLRGVLCLTDDYPWDYARFLKYAEELMFMYKVGGRYQFIHDLLQKHFAAMKPQKYSS